MGELQKGACYKVGGGTDISIWQDPWIPSIPNFKPSPRENLDIDEGITKVSDLFIGQDHQIWDIAKIQRLFDDASVNAILRIQLPPEPRPDEWLWNIEFFASGNVEGSMEAPYA